MQRLLVTQYRLSRLAGRIIATTAAAATLGRMPPFVSTSAIVVLSGRLLVVHDPIRDEPVLPGGHLKWREGPEEAVVREVLEETGIGIVVERLMGVFSGPAWAGERGVVRVVYEARATGGDLRPSPEGTPLWLDAAAFAHSQTRDAAVVRAWLVARDVNPGT